MMNSFEIVSFHDFSKIRCVVLPVGDIPFSLFDSYLSIIESCNLVQLADLTRDPNDKSALQNLNWKRGRIEFSFLRCPTSIGANEDLRLRDDLRNDWEEYQAHKKILCAIGIMHCPSSAQSMRADYDAFTELLSSKYNSVLVHRCFAMEKNVSDAPVDDRGSNIMEIPKCDMEKTTFYFNTLIQDFAYAVLRGFETEFERKVGTPYITTPLDADVAEKVTRSCQTGRLNKIKGDYCLLAGSPGDALGYYEVAKTECKQKSDWIWLAGAQEGYFCSLWRQEKDVSEALATFQEYLQYYNRGKALTLELEGYLKLAKWKREHHDLLEASNLLMTYHALGSTLSAQNKVFLLAAICFEFHSMGFYRKFAFFLRELAGLYEQLHMHGTREKLLVLSAPFFQLHELGSTSHIKPKMGECPVSERRGWHLLSALMLLELAKVAESRDDSLAYARYITYMLRQFPTTTSAKTQKDLSTLLASHTTKLLPSSQLDMTGLPLVASVVVVPALRVVVKKKLEVAAPSENSVFIFDPSRKKKVDEEKGPLVWAKGEVATARVTLVNDREFKIHIERIRLMCKSDDGAKFEAFSTSLTIAPKTTREVDLSGLPVQVGTLAIEGVEMQSFHIMSVHKLQQDRKELLVKVVDPLPQMHIESILFNGNHLNILEGAETVAVIAVENTGKIPVSWIRLTVKENMSSKPGVYAERKSVFSHGLLEDISGLDLLKEPLAPGQSEEIKLNVYGLTGTIAASFIIEYGLEGHVCTRKEIYQIPIFVRTALEVISFDVQLCNFDSCSLPSILRLEKDDMIQGRPLCLLLFTVANSTKSAFSVRAFLDYSANDGKFIGLDSDDDFICSPGSTRLFCLPMPRVWIPDEELEDLPKRTGQFIRAKPESELSAEQAHTVKLIYNYKKFLQRVVRLEWTSSSNQSGVLSLASIKVNLNIVRKILPAPLLLQFCMENATPVSSMVMKISEKVGQMFDVHACAKNDTNATLKDMAFTIKIHDYDSLKNDHGAIALWNGSLVFSKGQMQPASDCKNTVKFMFMEKGTYTLSIHCLEKEIDSFCVSETLLIKVE